MRPGLWDSQRAEGLTSRCHRPPRGACGRRSAPSFAIVRELIERGVEVRGDGSHGPAERAELPKSLREFFGRRQSSEWFLIAGDGDYLARPKVLDQPGQLGLSFLTVTVAMADSPMSPELVTFTLLRSQDRAKRGAYSRHRRMSDRDGVFSVIGVKIRSPSRRPRERPRATLDRFRRPAFVPGRRGARGGGTSDDASMDEVAGADRDGRVDDGPDARSKTLAPGEPARVRSLAIHRPGTPNVGSALVDAADEADEKDRHAEAEDLARKALAIREKVLGPAHRALVGPLAILADSPTDRRRYDEAEPFARRALAISERDPDSSHRAGDRDARLSGRDRHWEGKFLEADELTRRAVLARRGNSRLPSTEPDRRPRGPGRSTLGSAERSAEAVPILEGRGLLEANPGRDKRGNRRWVLLNLGGTLGKLGRFAEAEPFLRRSLAIREQEPEPSPDNLASSLNNLGASYLGSIDAKKPSPS